MKYTIKKILGIEYVTLDISGVLHTQMKKDYFRITFYLDFNAQ